MSLRIWTVTIALAGLALYTLSLLPETGTVAAPSTLPAEADAISGIPGAPIFPLIYRDPEPIEVCPYGDSLMLAPAPEPTISLPEHGRFDLCFQAYPIIPSVSQEVLS